MDDTFRPVTDDEMDATYAVPTVVVNRFVISTTPNHFRLAFGETRAGTGPINWRIALSMNPGEAYELRNILNRLLEPFEKDITAALQNAELGGTTDVGKQ